MTNTTEAALRDALERISKIAEMHRSKDGNRSGTPTYYDMQRILEVTDAALSQPSPASSTAGEDEVAFWHDVNIDDTDANREAVKAAIDFMRLRLSPSSGEPASVAVEAEARLLDIAAERAAQIRSSCFDYCTGDCNCAQAAEDAVSEMERLIAALSKPAPVEAASATSSYGKEPCPCGHPRCKKFFLTGIGSFIQGSGFTEEEADLILSALRQEEKSSRRETR